MWYGSTAEHRCSALKRLGHHVEIIDDTSPYPASPLRRICSRVAHRLGYPVDLSLVNAQLLHSVRQAQFDIVWIDKGLTIKPATLRELKKISPVTLIVGYSPDDMAQRHCNSRYLLASLPYYDSYITTKTYNVPELRAMGARHSLFIANAYAPEVHCPMEVTDIDRVSLGGAVGFIGAFEIDRANHILSLAEAGIGVRWWGGGNQKWANRHPNIRMGNKPLWGAEYAKAINCFDINLCFLRKINRDRQTTRSIEIPACGGFMLAERTDEHLELFCEGIEAEFFSNAAELIEKTRYYLAHPDRRIKIAQAGLRRCIESGYSNDERMKNILGQIVHLN